MELHTEQGDLTWDETTGVWTGPRALVVVIEAWPRAPIPQVSSVHRTLAPDESPQYALVHATAALTHAGLMVNVTDPPPMPPEHLPPGAVA